MPTIRMDNILNEYSFTPVEELTAKTLSPLMIAWMQTKYARVLKEKAATIVPTSTELDRDYLLALGELEGKLTMLQEFFMEHQEAQQQLNDPATKEAMELTGSVAIETLAARAAKQVD